MRETVWGSEVRVTNALSSLARAFSHRSEDERTGADRDLTETHSGKHRRIMGMRGNTALTVHIQLNHLYIPV